MKKPNLKRMTKDEIDEIKIDAYMSKEQTPIEWLKQKLWQRGAIVKKDFELFDKAIEKEKEHTQAKVLEALERYRVYAWKKGLTISDLETFIETKVKPKYEKKNS